MRASWSMGSLILLVSGFALLLAYAPATAESVYMQPGQTLVDIIDTPKTPHTALSPNREWLLLKERPSYPRIDELAERELGLAGMRIKPQTDGPSRVWPYNGLKFLRVEDLEERRVEGLPEKVRISNVSWSPDGSRIVFTNTVENGIELWVADLSSATAKRLTGPRISMTSRIAPGWLPDSRSLIICLVPENRGPEPEADRVPKGPVIQENLGKSAPARTYQDLLENPHDEALFEHYFTAQIATINLEGDITPLGEAGIIWDISPSPSGEYILVETIHRPFSYLVTAGRFPRRIEVLDARGNQVFLLVDRPLQEEIPIAYGSVTTGPRDVIWRHDHPATLCYAEALDGGDAGAEADDRDQVYLLPAPFTGDPIPLIRLSQRYENTLWCRDDLAIVGSWWWKTRNMRAWRVHPGAPETEPALLIDRSWEDRYNDPGRPLRVRNEAGLSILLTTDDGNSLLMRGDGASPEGDRPFLDKFDLATLETTRLFSSEAPYYERPITLLDAESGIIMTQRESVTEVPNLFVRNLDDGSLRQVSFFPHPTPQLKDIQKELIQYEREDGVQLSGTLYLPAGYKVEDGPLPMVMWAYPQEFKSADAAGQIDDSPYRFDWIGWWSPLLWLTHGYSVLDDPTMPIVGEGDVEPNDSYVDQLVSSAAAAVDEVVGRGVADPDRIAIGGHSYGAFMTANLLAHSDLFAAGLARTGAYNRTLTPFGFQSEERTLWEAPDVYFAMSPFMHANKIKEPLLLVHGEADNNPGTFPMQSERFYNALKGLGGTVRFVKLPHESHSYRARESILHLLWETQEWLDTYVKNTSRSD